MGRFLVVVSLISQALLGQIKMLYEYRDGNLGLWDISADGRLHALEEPLFKEKATCDVRDCNPYLNRVVIKTAAGHKTVGTVKLQFTGFRAVVIAFVPGTEDLLLRGKTVDGPSVSGFFRWTPSSGAIVTMPTPADAPSLEFFRFLDATRVIGRIGSGFAIWDWTENRAIPFSQSTSLEPLLAVKLPPGTLLEPLVGASEHVRRGIWSPDGRWLIAVSLPAGPPLGSLDPDRSKVYLSVYDAATRVRLSRALMFEREAERREHVDHIGAQIAVSARGDRVAISYEEQHEGFGYKRIRREPRFAVHELPNARLLGTVSHPAMTVSVGQAAVSPAAGGKLLFSPDGKQLCTTTERTRCWSIP